ncbi:hypothetical protein JW813_05030 [Clostridium botulinum]|uniref:hypothetical protein n=1 Tax=Clostridium botulinum TaxID=1491 RepID=UPI002246CCE8|nr:hypothetical protein [Clostridium botulinum]UZP04373.1 hypothetical protein JW813_05030 [Clostridium botulinum]UZP07731.1 hypothetical protein JYA71_05025 [Clostridium botulinum]UZP07785.1 hypothetical protein JYA71_05305 [Clostridium botulinum]UZP11112.1 hypothetical protein JYA74_05025 [Clostridium botulinum]
MDINEFKIRLLLRHGFEEKVCPVRKVIIYCYKGYEWTKEDVKKTSSVLLQTYIKYYDGEITEDRLNKAIEAEKEILKKAEELRKNNEKLYGEF